MRNISGLLLIGIFTFISIGVFAQGIDTSVFNSENREVLLKEIETVLSEFKRDDCEKTIQELKKSVKQGKFVEKHYDGFLKITDIIVKRKMKRYNFIQPLLNIMIDFAKNTNESEQNYEKWLELSIEVISGQDVRNTKLFEDYVKWSNEFWINGNLYKISIGSHNWRTDSKDFNIEYKNNELSIRYSDVTLFCINKLDSMTLKKCSFVYYPNRQNGGEFKIEKATVEWDQDGARDAKCDLNDFVISGR